MSAANGTSSEGPGPQGSGGRESTQPLGHAANWPIICFAGLDWWYHNRAHSDFQLMTGAARTRTVLLVNAIGMRLPLPGRTEQPFRRIWRKLRSMSRLVRRPVPELPGFFVFTPVLFPLYGIAWARRVNAWLVRCQVRFVARYLRIEEPVIIITLPTAWDVVRRMRRRSLIFNRSDKSSEFREADRESIQALENEVLRHADTVIYVSRELMEQERSLTGQRAHFLDHGVDLERFDPSACAGEPPDLRAIPHPRIGFFGALRDHLVDFDLLERLAHELPDAHLVLIGDATASMRRFEKFPNVHWLGFRSHEEIPSYGVGFDVAIMPWLDNEWIRNCNPIKLKEYLGLGLAVVSTDFPEVRKYAAYVRIARNQQEFVRLVRTTLDDGGLGTASLRRGAVLDGSWGARTRELLSVIEEGRTAQGTSTPA